MIDYAERNGAPSSIMEDLRALEDDGELYYGFEDIGVESPTTDADYGYNNDD